MKKKNACTHSCRSFFHAEAWLHLALLLSVLFLLNACEEDCPEGYSGKDCLVRASDTFIGTYQGSVNCGAGNQYASLELSPAIGPFEVRIGLLEDPGFLLKAHVYGDSLFITDQAVEIRNGNQTDYYFIFASGGRLTGDTLQFPLILLAAGIPDPEKVSCLYQVIK